MRPVRRRALLAVVVALVAFAGPDASARSDTSQPPPGANDWSCRPSAAHPNPVVLVHGTGATMASNWRQLSPLLASAGYCVFALDYGRRTDVPEPFTNFGGMLPMEESAAELAVFVDQVLAATGAARVDIVGHSQGSLMPNHYAKFLGGAQHIDRYVGLTPLWDGTDTLGMATLRDALAPTGLSRLLLDLVSLYCESCEQFFRGSAFIEQMNAGGGPRVPGITYTMLMTRHDELIVPYTSGIMDGATNIVIQDVCPADLSEHIAVAVDAVVHQLILNALDPAHASPVRCGDVLSNYAG